VLNSFGFTGSGDGGARASLFPQIQDLPMPVEKRTLANYLGHNEKKHGAELRRSFGHPNMGHHPATIGQAESTVTVVNQAGSGVVLVPH
jgi:hypothetical protein